MTRRWAGAGTVLLPVAVLLAVVLPHLDQGDWRSDTPWYAALSVQAWRTGQFWTLYAEPGEPYFNKPPLVFWIHGLLLHVGGVSLAMARLPTVLAAAGCVAATAWLARLVAGRAAGLTAGVVLALSYEFFRRSREISLDMWQCLFMLGALLLGAMALRQRRTWLVVAAGVPIGAALMCKPFVSLGALVLIASWFALERWWKGAWAVLLAAGLAAVIAAPWHVSMLGQHGGAFTDQYLGAEIVDRAGGIIRDQARHPPAWFYVGQLARHYWPWLAAVVAGIALFSMNRYGPRARRLTVIGMIWAVGWLVLVTAFPDRRDRYAIPVYPGLALIAAAWLSHGLTGQARAGAQRAVAWLAAIVIVGGSVVAVLPVQVQRGSAPEWGELLSWLRQHASEGLYEGGCDGAPAARIYLETGAWPRSTRDWFGRAISEPPMGALLFYEDAAVRRPGANETIVFKSGPLSVTRLGEGGWRPQ